MKKLFSLAIVVFCGGLLRYATADTIPLTVNLSFQSTEAGAAKANDAFASGDAWIFVIDHSGSMVENRDAVIEKDDGTPPETCTRWDAFLRTFPLIVEQIEFGSVAYLVKVGNRSGPAEIFPRQEIRSSEDQKALIKTVLNWNRPIKYDLTPLYGGLFLACQEAQRLIEKEGRNVCIVVFSDGNDFVGGKQFGQKRYTPRDIDNFKAIFAEDGFTACLNWINSTEKPADRPFGERYLWAEPKGGKVIIPIPCRVKPGMSSVSLENPMAAGGKVNLRIPYSVAISPKRWDTVLAEGFDADVRLRLPDGTDVGGDAVHVARGATSSEVCFRVPESYFAGGKGASFDLSLVFSEGVSACRFIQPPPVRLSFERQGAVTISAVKPGPDSGIVAKVGEAVSFSAEGTEGATFTWSFGDGANAKGARVSHPFAAPNPKGVPFSVLAEKPGLIPAKAEGSVVVVEAGVRMGAVPSGLKVGQTAVFTCTGVGEVASYDWFVDGEPVIGEDAKDGASSRLSYPLAKVGEHKVRVRANMRRVSPEVTPDVAFTVSPAPFAAISKPEPNERFDAEASVLLEASVEGGFATGVWTVKDASGAVVLPPTQSTVKDKASTAHFNVPEAGGEFSVSFAAGEGEGAIAAAPVQFSAKAKDVRLDVVLPLPDAEVETGAPVELKVASKGVSGNVVFVVSADGVETVVGRPAKVAADGSAGISHEFPVKDGQGDREIFARSEDGKVVSDPIPFRLKTNASIELKKPSNNAQVFYGETLDFEAEVSGIADSKEVRWFLRPAGGGEQALKDAKGARYTHQFDSVPNLKRLSCEVYARVGLPDGSPPLETDHAVVRVSCPDIVADLDIPKDAAPGKEFTARLNLDARSAPVKSVTWDFGDGTVMTAAPSDIVKHTYTGEGTQTVTAKVSCETCREERVFKKQLSAACPPLSPLVLHADPSGDIGAAVAFRLDHNGDASEYRWSFGDGAVETNKEPQASHAFSKAGTYTASVSAVCSSCGAVFDAAPATVEIQCPDLMPEIVCTKANGSEGASFGRNERIEMRVRVAKGMEGAVEDVAWDFGDGEKESSGARTSTHHEYRSFAKDIVLRATFKCRLCGKAYSPEKRVTVEVQKPVASFAVVPDRTTFSIRGRISLRDTSGGDVDRCVWTTNGVQFTTSKSGESVDLTLPGKPCEILIGLRAENEMGAVSEAQPRALRVRFGWWAALVFLVFTALVIVILWRILGSGNKAAGWKIYSWTRGEPVPNAKGSYEREADYDSADVSYTAREFWSVFTKRAIIPTEKLSEELGTALPGTSVTLEDAGGKPDLEQPGGMEDVTRQYKVVVQDGFWHCYRLSRETGKTPKYMRVVISCLTQDMVYAAYFWALTFILLIACFLVCVKFAI